MTNDGGAHDGAAPDAPHDLLEPRAFPELASALRAQVDEILAEWEAAVRRVLPAAAAKTSAELRCHLLRILPLLLDRLASGSAGEAGIPTEESAALGLARFQQHYDVADLMMEDRVLRRVVLRDARAALGRQISDDENVGLNTVIDEFLQQAVVALVARQAEHVRDAAEAELKYLSFLSHDLNTHLGSVTLLLQVLKQQLGASPQFAGQVANIDLAQKSIVETVVGMQRLLQEERLRKGAVQPKSQPVDLRLLAEQAARQYAGPAKEKGLTLDVGVAQGAVVNSDGQLIGLSLRNLLANAVKYSTKGTVRIGSERREAARWALSVSDQGPGIPAEHLGRIFEAFGRGEAHAQEGVGLGLTIVSHAAKLLGAELEVESEIGAGSTFRLVLPAPGAGGGPDAAAAAALGNATINQLAR